MFIPVGFILSIIFGLVVIRLFPGGLGAFLLIIVILIQIIIFSIVDVIDVIKSDSLSFFSKMFWVLMFPVLMFWILWMSFFTGNLFNEAVLNDPLVIEYGREHKIYGYVFNQFVIAMAFLVLPRKEKIILIPLYTIGVFYWVINDYKSYYDVYQFWYGLPMFFFAMLVVITMLIRRIKYEVQQYQRSIGWGDF